MHNHSHTTKSLGARHSESLKAKDVATLDVSRLTSVTDVMVVASGTSSRHVAALADRVIQEARSRNPAAGVEGRAGADWVLVDLGDLVVHVMLAETRQLYDLERLWADMPSDADVGSRQGGL
ncbi:ribosome silencing factor [Billgrantia gudaonensis]|uniref:Ribosomal silencing factor RsfS n=1 Tax=Billgrantia gudaonensis TaxID=376427 RepID=A0A3S0Q1H3_9GAMM|nr:ribosome silencing factor [Halomonas gudaonensis]